MAQIDQQHQPAVAEGELPFVNDQPGVNRPTRVLAGFDRFDDFVEGDDDVRKILVQTEPGRKISRGERAGHGDRLVA